MTAFVLIGLGAAIMLASMSLRSFLPLPRLVSVGVAVIGVVITAVGAFRL